MKNKIAGLKVFCETCKKENPKCSHKKIYRGRTHVTGTKNKVRIKLFKTDKYEDAVIQFLKFKQILKKTNFERITLDNIPSLLTVSKSIDEFKKFLNGDGQYIQYKKNRTHAYVKQVSSHINTIFKDLKEKQNMNIDSYPISRIGKKEVSLFYDWRLDSNMNPSYFNKHIASIKLIFDFVIRHKQINMVNPFIDVVRIPVEEKVITSVTLAEFNSILNSVSDVDSFMCIGVNNQRKNMYFNGIKEAFKLLLFVGGRLEEVLNLKWSDIIKIEQNESVFHKIIVKDLKVNRIKKNGTSKLKSTIVHADLMNLLIDLGLHQKIGEDEYIICPDRTRNNKNFISLVSKSFSFFRDKAGVRKDISIKHLRKTYITWVNSINGYGAHIITGHSGYEILDNHYINPFVVNGLEMKLVKYSLIESLS